MVSIVLQAEVYSQEKGKRHVKLSMMKDNPLETKLIYINPFLPTCSAVFGPKLIILIKCLIDIVYVLFFKVLF